MQPSARVPKSVANTLLFLLVVAVSINYVDRGALSVSAPLIVRDLGISTSQMGILFSAFFWTYASFQLVAGWLVDRYSIKWVYAGAFLVWSLATAAVGLVHSFPMLLAARLVLGIGESVAYPASSKVIVRYFPEARRGFANSLVDAGSKAGPGLSTLLGGLAVNTYGWRAMFIFVGVGSLLWLIPWMLVRPEEQVSEAVEKAAREESPAWGQILQRRQLWGASLGMFSLGYVVYFLLSWLPSYLVQERGFSMADMALVGSAPFWAMSLASLAGGWTSDYLVRAGRDPGIVRKLYAVSGLVLCGLAILPAPAVASPGLSVALITAACAFIGLFTSNVWAVSQTLAGPHAAGRWTGIQNCVGNLGGVLSPLFTGWIVTATGSFQWAFWLASAVLFGGAAAYYLMLGTIRPLAWAVPGTAAREAA